MASNRYTRRQITRNNGQYARYITGKVHSHPDLFSDEDQHEPRRLIEVQFRPAEARNFVSVFNILVEKLAGSPYSRKDDMNKPALYTVGEWYRIPRINIGGVVEMKIVTVYPMGMRWRLQVEFKGFVKPTGAVLMQHQFVALNPVQMYRGYLDDETDSDWPIPEYKNPLDSRSL